MVLPGGNGDVPSRAALDALRVRLEELAAAVAAVQAALDPAAACRELPAGTGDDLDPDPPPASPPAAGACRAPDGVPVLAIARHDLEQMVHEAREEIQATVAQRKRPGSFFSHFD